MGVSSAPFGVIRPKEVIEEAFVQVFEAHLARVLTGGFRRQATAEVFSAVRWLSAGSVEREREAAQHGCNHPSGVAFIQKDAGGSPFIVADRPVPDLNLVDQYSGGRVRLHGHVRSPRRRDVDVRQICAQDCPGDGASERSHGVISMMAARALGAGNALGPCDAACGEKLAASLGADDVESSARLSRVANRHGLGKEILSAEKPADSFRQTAVFVRQSDVRIASVCLNVPERFSHFVSGAS